MRDLENRGDALANGCESLDWLACSIEGMRWPKEVKVCLAWPTEGFLLVKFGEGDVHTGNLQDGLM